MLSILNTVLFYTILAVILGVGGWMAFKPEEKNKKE
jgi:hypothetical protein